MLVTDTRDPPVVLAAGQGAASAGQVRWPGCQLLLQPVLSSAAYLPQLPEWWRPRRRCWPTSYPSYLRHQPAGHMLPYTCKHSQVGTLRVMHTKACPVSPMPFAIASDLLLQQCTLHILDSHTTWPKLATSRANYQLEVRLTATILMLWTTVSGEANLCCTHPMPVG